MVNESMANNDVDSDEADERASQIDQKLQQAAAIQVVARVVCTSPEASLFMDEITVLLNLSRELIEECREINRND